MNRNELARRQPHRKQMIEAEVLRMYEINFDSYTSLLFIYFYDTLHCINDNNAIDRISVHSYQMCKWDANLHHICQEIFFEFSVILLLRKVLKTL